MNTINYPNTNLNPNRLSEELRAVLGAAVIPGISWTQDEIRVHVSGAITRSILDTVDTVITAHDPAALTDAQQKRADLIAERIANSTPIDPDDVTIRDIARRLRWMEKEIRARLLADEEEG